MATYTWEKIEKKARQIVVEQLGVDEGEVTLNANLVQELGADSLDTVELVMAFEEQFDIDIPDALAEKMLTLADGFRLMAVAFPRKMLALVESKLLSFRLRADGTIEVRLQLEDGSWTFADGQTLLPSTLCLFTFSKWGSILKTLEELVNDPKTKEEDLQKFFEEFPELIAGDDYDHVIPQATISRDDQSPWRADFVLAPIDQAEFTKILELKLPDIPLTTSPRRGHVTFSAQVWRAISQLRDYARAFDSASVRDRFRAKYKTDVYKPDLHLIAGRQWDLQWMDSIRSLRQEQAVKIENWDAVLDRLRRRFV